MPELIPRPMLRHTTLNNDGKPKEVSWEYGGSPGGEARWEGDNHTSVTKRHYFTINDQEVRHDPGDVYSVSQGYDSRGTDTQRPQQPPYAVWRGAPWADTNT